MPAPRFFWLLTYHFDIGVYMLPKHIFEGQDISTFTHFDIEKGWPVTTGPWRVVHASPQQKILDRADDWWGVAAGVAELPAVERFILLPDQGEQQLVQSIITNEVDFTTGIQPSSFPTVLAGNPKATSWTGRESPYGYVDWWPHSLYVNNEVAPWSDQERALGDQLLHRPRRHRRGRLVRRLQGDAAAACPTTRRCKPYFDATKPLLEKYNTLEYNPEKGDALLTAKGWTKNADGMWLDENGAAGQARHHQLLRLHQRRPGRRRVAEARRYRCQLLRTARMFATFSEGNYHRRALRPRWKLPRAAGNPGALPEQLGGDPRRPRRQLLALEQRGIRQARPTRRIVTHPTDTEKLIDIWVRAMEIWLPELPDILLTHGFHRLPWTTEYWTNMPDQNNPYTNSAQWHLTFPLVLHNVKPAQA